MSVRWTTAVSSSLQKVIGSFSQTRDVISIAVTPQELLAVCYVDEGNKGVDVSYSSELTAELQNFAWLADKSKLLSLLKPLEELFKKEEYAARKTGVLMILVDYAFCEQLEYPLLEPQELEAALAWEVPEHVPWPKESYEYKYLVKNKSRSDATSENQTLKEQSVMTSGQQALEEQQVEIFAVEKQAIACVAAAAESLQWRLVALTVASGATLPVDVGADVENVEFYEEYLQPAALQAKKEKFMVPVQAAEAFLQGKLKVNFLPPCQQLQGTLVETQRFFLGITIVCLTLAMIIGWGAIRYASKQEEAGELLKLKAASFDPWERRMQELSKLRSLEQSLIGETQKLQRQRQCWSKNIAEIGRNMPDAAWLTRLEAQGDYKKKKALLLHCSTVRQEAITELLHNMEASQLYKDVELISTSQRAKPSSAKALAAEQSAKEEILSFNVRASLKEVEK